MEAFMPRVYPHEPLIEDMVGDLTDNLQALLAAYPEAHRPYLDKMSTELDEEELIRELLLHTNGMHSDIDVGVRLLGTAHKVADVVLSRIFTDNSDGIRSRYDRHRLMMNEIDRTSPYCFAEDWVDDYVEQCLEAHDLGLTQEIVRELTQKEAVV